MTLRTLASATMEDPKPQTPAGNGFNGKQPVSGPGANRTRANFEVLLGNELTWQPYREMSRVLLQTHKNFSAYVEANRKLAAEMQAILSRAQDMALRLSETALTHMSTSSGTLPSAARMEELYEFTISSIRELGEATVAAQIRSIEMLREHARNSMGMAN